MTQRPDTLDTALLMVGLLRHRGGCGGLAMRCGGEENEPGSNN